LVANVLSKVFFMTKRLLLAYQLILSLCKIIVFRVYMGRRWMDRRKWYVLGDMPALLHISGMHGMYTGISFMFSSLKSSNPTCLAPSTIDATSRSTFQNAVGLGSSYSLDAQCKHKWGPNSAYCGNTVSCAILIM